MDPSARRLYIIIGIRLLAVSTSRTASAQPAHGPREPYVDRGACPFECCQYGPWVAHVAVPVYAEEGEARRPQFRVQPGDSIRAERGDVILRRVGRVVVRQPIPRWARTDSLLARVRVGDTVFVLSPIGEGWYRLWYRGRIGESPGFWDTDNLEGGQPAFGRLVVAPQVEWWAHIRTRSGRSGWIIPPTLGISGLDSCA
jgi:hypothetical protein